MSRKGRAARPERPMDHQKRKVSITTTRSGGRWNREGWVYTYIERQIHTTERQRASHRRGQEEGRAAAAGGGASRGAVCEERRRPPPRGPVGASSCGAGRGRLAVGLHHEGVGLFARPAGAAPGGVDMYIEGEGGTQEGAFGWCKDEERRERERCGGGGRGQFRPRLVSVPSRQDRWRHRGSGGGGGQGTCVCGGGWVGG